MPQGKERLKLNKTVPGDINSDNTDEILDPTFQKLSKLNMIETKITDISPDLDTKSDNLCPLEIMRAALNSLNIINWSLFV